MLKKDLFISTEMILMALIISFVFMHMRNSLSLHLILSYMSILFDKVKLL